MFKLVIQDDEGKTTVVPLIRDEITIGRKEGNTIRLTERNVSRRHARILRNNGEVQIEDLGSYNGIRVNNARIAERVSLRVSDQVQIGDYKLYLKAEGVEQVDDARTMPIERIDNAMPTDVMPAMQVATQPMAVAMPNRTAVAVADTDPAGRPVATAAQVAALTAPPGYGRMVIVSSNFAGKEYELTRPQMIVGRTDENDIVINHRSISRNHAKVTRDPENGRYTISDLQSSNGVRVNGQDYGKVELRRGDTIDLGHVRLRFVEPGEDFIFARDAVIADVPEAGGRRGLLVALLVGGLLLVGAITAFVMLKGNKEDKPTSAQQGSDTGSVSVPNNHVAVAPVPDQGSNVIPSQPEQTVKPAATDELSMKKAECEKMGVEQQKWTDAMDCAAGLEAQDKAWALSAKKRFDRELANNILKRDIDKAVAKKDLSAARKKLKDISEDSVYREAAQKQIEKLEDDEAQMVADRAKMMASSGSCGGYDKLVAKAEDISPKAKQAVLSIKCDSKGGAKIDKVPSEKGGDKGADKGTPVVKLDCTAHPEDKRCAPVAPPAPPANCDADALKEKGMENVNMGQHGAALSLFEASLRCKRDPYLLQLAFMEACASSNSPKAKLYYKLLTPAQQSKFAQMCLRTNTAYQ